MYAVIATGGKQYRVEKDQVLFIDKQELEPGASIEFDQVLMIGEGDSVNIGAPYVKGGKVTASVEEHGRDKKVNILKFKRRKHHMKRQGHRQWYTKVKITEVKNGS